MIRYVVAALSALTILSASAAHIVLDNGDTRLIADDEQVFIVKQNQRLWFLGKKAQPIDLGEAPVEEPEDPPVVDGPDVGSREWCEAFDTEEEGYSFDRQDFDRQCDTNSDGKYVYCEDYIPFQNGFSFEDQSYYRECSS